MPPATIKHVKWPTFLSEIELEISRQIFAQVHNTKFDGALGSALIFVDTRT